MEEGKKVVDWIESYPAGSVSSDFSAFQTGNGFVIEEPPKPVQSYCYGSDTETKRSDEQQELNTKDSLAQVILLYWKHTIVLKKTARNNALSLLKMFEVVNGRAVRPENVSLWELTPELIRNYQQMSERKYIEALGSDPDPAAIREARERALRSTRSTITQARSLFARRGEIDLWEIYRANGIEIPPSVERFCACRVRGKHKTDYKAPPDDVVQRSFDAIELMKKDVSVYLAFWLAVGAGLRRTEIRFCKWEYLKQVDGKPRIMGGIGKNGKEIDVPLQLRAYQAIEPFSRQDGFMIPERGLRWSRRLAAWMRGQGWQTRLAGHELRAYIGSLIYRESPLAAKQFLRHGSIIVTERNYVRYGGTAHVPDLL
jgi:integrase